AGKVQRLPVKDLKIRFDRKPGFANYIYKLNLSAKQFDFPSLQLLSPYFDFEWIQTKYGGGKASITVPVFKLRARGGSHGYLRGPLWIKSLNPASKPLIVDIDRSAHILTVKDLNFSWGAIAITDKFPNAKTSNPIWGADIDGVLRGNWK